MERTKDKGALAGGSLPKARPLTISAAAIFAAALYLALAARGDSRSSGVKTVDFDREIRPILSDTCFACHGPDEKQRMAKLRLDTKDGLFEDRGTHKLVVPGDLASSLLYQRISAPDKAKRMPPPYAQRHLTDQQVDLIRRWIEQGAKWELHWAFVPPKRPELPKVSDTKWPRNAIDHFILARLEADGLKPSPEADKAAL